MATALRPIAHDDRLSVVDHLDELRSRLMICAVVFVTCFLVAFWQNGRLLEILNEPLERSTPTAEDSGGGRLAGVARAQFEQRAIVVAEGREYRALSRSPRLAPADRERFATLARLKQREADVLPQTIPVRRPITTGVGEPFTTTLTVALWFGLIFALPVLLYQAYAFVLPAFSPREKRVALPLMLMIPFLFVGGVIFGYYMVLPSAVKFLQNFNDDNFDVLLQARDYYRFSIFSLLALGLCFQMPVGMLALSRVGIVSSRTLLKNWRIEVVVIAAVAAVLPGVDPVTTLLLMVPLLGLFGLSILLVKLSERGRDTSTASGPSWWQDEDKDEDEGDEDDALPDLPDDPDSDED